MKTPIQIEVEPLDSDRWAKIERSLFVRLEREPDATLNEARAFRPRRVRMWVAAAAVAGAVGGAGLSRFDFSERPVVEQPSRVTTGVSASHLALPGLSLDVAPESAVVVGAETPQGLLVVVDRGTVSCDVAPRTSGAPLIVQAGAARVRVVGTRFTVTRLGESAEVVVQKGVVEVSEQGRSWRVQAGESWPKPPEPTAGSDDATVAASAAAKRSTPERPLPPVGPGRTAVRAQDTSQSLFEQATGLERSDPRRAAELYSTVERGGDSWAQNALYAHGRLEASRGNGGEARRLLERYLERFPNGKNADDARAVLKRLR
jgi:hypothetical protein